MFCEEGSPPIAFTLGTGMTHAADFFRTAVAACDALGARGLLLTKYPHVIPTRLPPRVRHCTFAPFRQLLPLCGAVVHHGGVGTTAAALEAGCPQLILPLAWDQPDNAARVAALGAGLALGSRRRSSGHLSRALARLLAPDFVARVSESVGGGLTPALAYQLSKAALVRMCQQRARAWGARGARIVSLSPGLIATPMGALEFEAQPAKRQLFQLTPLGREGTMVEIADAVEFLISDRASFITGTDLLVDGGVAAAARQQAFTPPLR